MEKNGQKGITLIALIITIIVLILLAGISISMISGQDGLLSRAGKTTEMQSNAQVSEAMSLIYNEYIIEQKTNGNTEDFIDYVKATGKVNDNGVVDTKKLTGGKIALGKGTDSSDVYKLEKVGNDYIIRYYGENEDDEIKTIWSSTGNVADVEPKIEFSYEEFETESRAVALRIYAKISNIEMINEVADLDLYSQYIDDEVNKESLKEDLLYWKNEGRKNYTWSEISDGHTTVKDLFESISGRDEENYVDWMINNELINPEQIYSGKEKLSKEEYEIYARKYIENVQDGPELIKIFVDGFNFWNGKFTWLSLTHGEASDTEEYFNKFVYNDDIQDYKQWIIDNNIINNSKYEEYVKKHSGVYDITVSCNGQTETTTNCAKYNTVTSGINIEDKNNGELLVTCELAMVSNGEYDAQINVGAIGSKRGKVKITKCKAEKEEKYSAICNTNTEIESDGYTVTVPAGFAYGISDNVKSVNAGFVITDSVDANGNSTGSEFVWIPIDKEKLTVGKTDKAMAEGTDETNYKGKVYYFEKSGNEIVPTPVGWYEEYTTSNGGIQMLQSVKKYGGFYVARYEIALENKKTVSKLGYSPVEQRNSTFLINYESKFDSVISDVIWRSQVDAMKNFILTGNDTEVWKKGDFRDGWETVVKTGLNRKRDLMSNIYDLNGNCIETVKSYTWQPPNNTRFSTRMSLYIK